MSAIHFPKWKIILVVIACLIGIALALPNVLPSTWLQARSRVNLGLDLRGGSYLLLHVDFDAYLKEQIETLTDDIRHQLRDAKVGYTGLGVQGTSATFTLRDASEYNAARSAIRNISRDLDVSQGAEGKVIVAYREDGLKQMQQNVLGQSIEIVRRRVDETGTREPIIQRQGNDRILLQVPGLEDPQHLKDLLGKTAKMTFHLMDADDPFPEHLRPASAGTRILQGWRRNNQQPQQQQDMGRPKLYAIQRTALITGDMLVNAYVSYEQGLPVVAFRFNNQGARKFGDATKENVGKPFAIVLDDEVISAPVIREPILGGSGIISGGFTTESANDLALLLRAGALPAPIQVIEERTVGPSLGADSIAAGLKASLFGILLVATFMIVSYGLFGFFANVALVMNIVLVVGAMSLLQATLTLPGIAGIVLTMGMAVDTNVLIYERMREEVRLGKTPIAAIDQGFTQAFRTIFDAHVTTLIATVLLYAFGSGSVKGFAVTLAIGITSSLFTAVMFTRMIVVLWLRKFRPQKLPI